MLGTSLTFAPGQRVFDRTRHFSLNEQFLKRLANQRRCIAGIRGSPIVGRYLPFDCAGEFFVREPDEVVEYNPRYTAARLFKFESYRHCRSRSACAIRDFLE